MELDTNTSLAEQTPPIQRPQQYMEPDSLKIIRILVEIAIGLFGVGGNLVVCVAIATRKRLKSIGNLFVFNLALADLGVLLICLPLVMIHSDFPYSWPFGKVVCQVLYPFTDIFYGVSIGSIVAISFHRYRMIVHCMETQLTATKAKIIIVIIWIVSYIFFVLPVNLVMELKQHNGKTSCVAVWPNIIQRQLHVTFVSILFYLLPLMIISGTYLRIRHKLKADSFLTSQMQRRQHSTVKARLDQNRKALSLLTPVVITFAVLMFPINALRLYAAFHQHHGSTFRYLRLLYNLSVLLLLANSSINCVIYAVVNKDFRREFKRLLCCVCLKKLYRALPSPSHHQSNADTIMVHSLYDPKTMEDMLSHHEHDPRHSHLLAHDTHVEGHNNKRRERLVKMLKEHEVKDLLTDNDYENSVQYCAYDDNLTIVVK